MPRSPLALTDAQFAEVMAFSYPDFLNPRKKSLNINGGTPKVFTTRAVLIRVLRLATRIGEF